MTEKDNSWCTIESDPGVFTELLDTIGVKDVQVEELYALDPTLLQELKPVYGLIFLFKWDEKLQKEDRKIEQVDNSKLFFAKQVIQNACATQAILSILFNRTDQIDIGPGLKEFKTDTKDFSPEMKGLAIGNSEVIKKAHNSFRRPEGITVIDKLTSGKEEDAFHFISYLPINGSIYELDGLQKGPINLGSCSEENWLEKVTPLIEERIAKYSGSEIRFNLMAIIKNKKSQYQAEKARLEDHLSKLNSGNAMQTDDLPATATETQAKIQSLNDKILDEEDKFKVWKEENVRRRHNYIPFLFNLLIKLGEHDKLLPLLEKAKKKQQDRQAEKEKKKAQKTT